jgi:hypothetical protein
MAVSSGPPMPDRPDWDGPRWSVELDLDADSAAPRAAGAALGPEEVLAAEVAACGLTDAPPPAEPAAAIAEILPAGPGLARFLSGADPETAADPELIAMAEAFRRVASWAQAGELAMIAQVAARSAAADPRAGLAGDGRPALLTEDATAQVSLGLTLSHTGAEAWTGLAVTLRWRLPRTAAALAAGRIDLYRAKILAEAVIPLSDAAAKAVEDRVIPRAGDLTYGQLHAAVRRAVIAADPEGAEHRRAAAERRAKLSLYPDQDGTATLVGARLPAAEAAAAYAKICAIANAMKAAGAGGGIHFLRCQALLGLILATLPPIPPPAGGPPDGEPPPHRDGGDGDGGDGWTPDDNSAAPEVPPVSDADLPEDDGFRDAGPPVPDGYTDWDPARGDPLDDHFAGPGTQWAWPPIPPAIPAGGLAGGVARGLAGGQQRPGGLLDLTLPWATLTCAADGPGILGRVGPITAVQARQLARLANRGDQTQWRVILADAEGHCIGVTRIPRIRPPTGPEPPGLTDVVGRVTVVLPATVLDSTPRSADRRNAGIYAEIICAARRVLARSRERAAADASTVAGCAHTEASASYRPPPRIREYVEARDLTCRYPSCGQPAWRGDLDHTHPWEQGGLTCPCNMGALCRRHHRLKQLRGWDLVQPQPGIFRWVTPAGLTYAVQPDRQPS